jgi:Fur family ferric uptake transcriptional regulator
MSHEALNLAALLRREGYKMTLQRQMVLDAVCEAGGHATPEQIYEIVSRSSEAVNRTTVYRTLRLLQDLRLINAASSVEGHLRYEMSKPQPHHHLVCRDCGTDIELSHDLFVPLLDQINEAHDFDVETTHLTLHGRCSDCVQKN